MYNSSYDMFFWWDVCYTFILLIKPKSFDISIDSSSLNTFTPFIANNRKN